GPYCRACRTPFGDERERRVPDASLCLEIPGRVQLLVDDHYSLTQSTLAHRVGHLEMAGQSPIDGQQHPGDELTLVGRQKHRTVRDVARESYPGQHDRLAH